MSALPQRNFFGRGAGRTHFMLNVAVSAANWQMPVLVVMLDEPAVQRAKKTLKRIMDRRALSFSVDEFITVVDSTEWRSGRLRGREFRFEYVDHAVDEALGRNGFTLTELERFAKYVRAFDKDRGPGMATLADLVRELEAQ